MAFLEYWEEYAEDGWKNLWKRLAVICRYGHIGYEEALRMPVAELNAFGEALNELLEDEAEKGTPNHED